MSLILSQINLKRSKEIYIFPKIRSETSAQNQFIRHINLSIGEIFFGTDRSYDTCKWIIAMISQARHFRHAVLKNLSSGLNSRFNLFQDNLATPNKYINSIKVLLKSSESKIEIENATDSIRYLLYPLAI